MGLRILQINLHKSKLASVELLLNLVEGGYDVQEPWIGSGNIVSGLESKKFNTYFPSAVNRVRTAILVSKSISSYFNSNLSTDDLTVVTVGGVGNENLLLASCYLPHENDAPTSELQRLATTASERRQELVVGADANSHHTVWGCTDTNSRGESLFNFILQSSLVIANRGEEPTFIGPTSKNVLDITLCTGRSTRVENWCLVHHHTQTIGSFPYTKKCALIRNPRKTNWDLYGKILDSKRMRPAKYNSHSELEEGVKFFTNALVKAYSSSCTPTRIKSKPMPPWWNKELGLQRLKVREFYKLAKLADNEFCWGEFKDLQKEYKKAIRKAKRESWKDFCGEIEKTNEVARLRKLMSKNPAVPKLIRRSNDVCTDNCEESLEDLVSVHFPGCNNDTNDHEGESDSVLCIPEDIITANKVEWAINSFDPFKSPGIDGIFPAMLQKVTRLAVPWLREIFIGCLRFGYVPHSWREARVVFIPKAGKCNPAYSKEYRPISLTSFMLKTLEKILDAYIRESLAPGSLSKAQHAYTKGKSVETALHSLVLNIEKALEYKEYSLGTFLDISGAFNNVSKEAIMNSLETLDIEPAIHRWIKNLLGHRRIRAEWNEARLVRVVSRGTPQGGVLSPLLWLLVVNKILKKFDGKAPKLIAYADDIAIVVTGKCLSTISSIMTNTLRSVQQWADQAGLSLNADKTDTILFTRKYKIPRWTPPVLNGVALTLKQHTKYLGVVLDSKLLWNSNVEERVKKANNALYACKRMLGATWGISPSLMHWCYTAVVRPILLYGTLVWWTVSRKSSYIAPMTKVQRLAALCITGALRTTPTAALEYILDLPPIDLFAENLAAKSAGRLKALNEFSYRTYGHSSIHQNNMVNMDYMAPVFKGEKRFKITIGKEGWRKGLSSKRNTLNFYTDGSKMDSGVGAGIYCPELDLKESYKLPDYCSVFQAEVFAVGKAADLACMTTRTSSKVNFYIDSQAAIKAITSFSITSKIVLQSREAVEKLAANCKLHFYWVPGHKGIEGNEIVDDVAKNGVSLSSDLVNEIPKSIRTLYNELDENMIRKFRTRWQSLSTCKFAKIMCKQDDNKRTSFILSLARRDCRAMIGVLTGHSLVAAYAYKIGISDSEECRKCRGQGSRETVEHLLCECPALFRTRLKHLGASQFNRLEDISAVDWKCLLKFAIETGTMREDYFKTHN